MFAKIYNFVRRKDKLAMANVRYNNREELRRRVVSASGEMFFRNGIRQVKMDDIASKLSISKRTLYEIFANKEELLHALFDEVNEQQRQKNLKMSQGKHDVIEIVVGFYRMQTEELMSMSPAFFADLSKYPSLVDMMRQRRKQQDEMYMAFMERGVSEGMFRTDVNYSILHDISSAAGEAVMTSGMYEAYSPEEIFRNILFILLRGICTEAGIRRLDELLAQI